jgi:hypothetical protein
MSANQQIKAAHARNLAVQRSRLASMLEVGIFWLIDNKLVADSIPWRPADIYWWLLQRKERSCDVLGYAAAAYAPMEG